MKVYVVELGERYQGGSVVGIFRIKKKAIQTALAQKTDFPGGWKEYGENRWHNGCDYVKIFPYEVK